MDRTYIAIDLKSFYASAECAEMGYDPLNTNLVVADSSRTEKTICLAVSPSLKAYGISGRARLFEVVEKVKQINALRRSLAPNHTFTGKSSVASELSEHPELELDFVIAPPRMALYMKKSTEIYNLYLKYIAPEDIHVYSIDEVFIDATGYLDTYHLTAHQLAMKLVQQVLKATGITATAGIGTNLYLSKVAMDIVAKHIPADKDGVRIAELDELSYRRTLWTHQPLTDFWRVGRGYQKKLQSVGICTMGDIARCSIGKPTDFYNEDLLYRLFGINAELLIDHAWGWEPCTIGDIRSYRPESSSLSSGQVLHCPYEYQKARLIVREMTELLALDLVEKKLVTNQVVLAIGYDRESLTDPNIRMTYRGPVSLDYYGRRVPKSVHGSENLGRFTSSSRLMVDAALRLFDRMVDPILLVRRVNIVANHVIPPKWAEQEEQPEQLSLFEEDRASEAQSREEEARLEREHRLQETQVALRSRFGKNAVLKGMNLEVGATTISRNQQIGGHRAGKEDGT